MEALKQAIEQRDIGRVLGLMFTVGEDKRPRVRTGYNREGDLWDFKEGLPGARGAHDPAWAHIAADLLAFHNSSGGVLFFGVTDHSLQFVGTRDFLDAKLFNDKVRRYLGDKVWVEFSREFIQADQRYLGVALIQGRGILPLRAQCHAPPDASGARRHGKQDLAAMTGAEKLHLVDACSRVPLAIEWLVGHSKNVGAAQALAAALDSSGRRGAELLEFCFRRVHDQLSPNAATVLASISLDDQAQVLEALGAASGLGLEEVDEALGELERCSLVEKVWDPLRRDFAHRSLPLTRRFARRNMEATPGEEVRLRTRLSTWYEGRDIDDPAHRRLVRELRSGARDPDAVLVDEAITYRRAVVAAVVALFLWSPWRAGESPVRDHAPAPPGARPPATAEERPVPPPMEPGRSTRRLVVLDPGGRPAADARISYVASGRESEPPVTLGATGPDGRAAWPEERIPLPGLLRAEKEGFAPGDAVATSRENEVVVRLGAELALGGVVVRRSDGAPVPDATIRIQYDRHSGPLGPILGTNGTFAAAARSGSDGSFRLAGLATSSQALLTVTCEGFAERRFSWSGRKPGPVRIELDRPLSLRVLLRDRDGNPLPGGSVALGRDPRTLSWRDGMFAFSWVPLRDLGDGSYGAEGLSSEWYWAVGGHEGYRPADGGWIGVREGGPAAEIVLEPAAGIRGRVVDDATGRPVVGARLSVMPFLSGEDLGNTDPRNTREAGVAIGDAAGAASGPGGEFVLSCAAPGDPSLLSVRADGYWPFAGRVSNLARESAVEIRLRPLGDFAVRGRVVDASGVPVPGAVIRWEGLLGLPSGAAAAGPDGRFEVKGLTGGQYPVAMAPGYFPTTLPIPAETRDGDYGDVVLLRVLEVRGRVVDPEGTPVPGVAVGWEHLPGLEGRGFGNPVVTRVVAADGAGNLVVPAVPVHDLLLRPLWGERWTGEVRVPSGATGLFTLVVTPKPRGGTGVVRGRILRADGSPPADPGFAMVWPEEGDAPASGVQPGMAGPDGTFVMEGVPAGRWRVRAQSKEGSGETHGIVLAEGGSAEVTVVLQPWPKPDPAKAPVTLRILPVGSAARAVTAWATEGDRRSQSLQPKGEELVGPIRPEAPVTVWIADPTASTAAIAPRVDPRDAMPVSVSLSAAGRLLILPRKDGQERWITVRGSAGEVPWSNLETSLPGVAGKGYTLLLPPGEYEVTLSLGLARREPESCRVTVRVGEDTEVAPK